MESEKVKEIKKALEDNKTDHLPYIDEWKCKFVEYADILTLINELESENETLRNAKVVYETVDYCYEDLKKAEKRIAELEKENAKYKRKLTTNQWVQEIRKEALKQFAERLKEKMYENENGYIEFLSGKNAVAVDIVDFENCLDETLKEMIK